MLSSNGLESSASLFASFSSFSRLSDSKVVDALSNFGTIMISSLLY